MNIDLWKPPIRRVRSDRMQKHTFARIWWLLVLVGLIGVASLYLSLRFLMPFITGGAQSNDIGVRLLLIILLAVGGPCIFWILLRDVLTAFTDEGIMRPP